MGDEELDPKGRYVGSSQANTSGTYTDPHTGEPVMSQGMGIKANLNDMTNYADDMNHLQMNFSHMGRSWSDQMDSSITGAFGGEMNTFEWSGFMNGLSRHNVQQINNFLTNVSLGIMNVAMAAQTVANVYAKTDTTSAASINSVLFAFGDRDKAPSTVPRELLEGDRALKTTDELAAQYGPANPGAVIDGDPTQDVGLPQTMPDGSTVYTVKLPDGRIMTTTVTPWSTYPGGPGGDTKTVTIDGKQTESVHTSTVGSTTTTTTTSTTYDKDGVGHDQVTGVKKESTDVDLDSKTVNTTSEVTSYTYDSDGKKLDESTTSSNVSVGIEAPDKPLDTIRHDPVVEEQMRRGGVG